MKFISHRGNLSGKSKFENDPEYIIQTLSLGFDVEVDVWLINENLYLGHDEPKFEIDLDFLTNNSIWCHAKNQLALLYLNKNSHVFWHENDKFTLTSKNYIWSFPDKHYLSNTIAVLPEINNVNKTNLVHCAGVCSDYIQYYKEQLCQ